MLKNIVVLLIIASISLFSLAFAFNDIDESHWAYNEVSKMANDGYLKGYEDNSFKPNKEVTREEFAQMFYNVLGKDASIKDMQNYFDVKEDRWSYKAVQLVGYSICETSDGYVYFLPTQPIKREEVARVIADFFEMTVPVEYLEYPEVLAESAYHRKVAYELKQKYGVSDASAIDMRYTDAVYSMYKSGYMKGVTETEFSPQSSLTRAQAAVLLYRIINKDNASQSSSDLDLGFLKLENGKKNLIYSPLSIKYALKMLSEGAGQNTKKEIDNLVGNINLTSYKNIEKVLSLANGIFVRNTYSQYVKDQFKNTLVSKYSAEVISDEFNNAKNVNNWISNKTFNIINNMIKDDVVKNPDLQMLLINALAINMEWAVKFDTLDTNGRDFYKEDGTKIRATTMNKETSSSKFGYYLDDDITVVSMDLHEYDNNTLQFVAIMPKKDKLTQYVNTIKMETINNIIKNITLASDTTGGIDLYIPKFSFEYDLALKEDLKSMGMKDAFDKFKADFKNITNKEERLYVGDALHKAKIDFTEKGIKAAAVTVMAAFELTSADFDPPKIPKIRVDNPFLFLIRDKKNGEIWFIGTVYEPNLWENDQEDYNLY